MKKIFLATFLIASSALAKEVMSLKDYLKLELGTHPKISKEVFTLKAEELKQMKNLAPQAEENEITFYYGKSNEGKILKACSVVPQAGKEGPMILGICFLPDGNVASVQVLNNSEERGQQALTEKYLKQYQGKKVSDAFQVGQDIDGVSGATWTSKAVAEALRKASFGYKQFVQVKL